MIRSMTGFGVGSASVDGWTAEATMRSVNHRFLAVRIRSVGDRPWLYAQIEEKVRAQFSRGDVGVWLSVAQDAEADGGPRFDQTVARRVYSGLRSLSTDLGLSEPPTLSDLIRAGGFQPPQEDEEALWPAVDAALDVAIARMLATREREGAVLSAELLRLVDALDAATEVVEQALPGVRASLREKLEERIRNLDLTVNPERLETELALYADRFEVQEELVRLKGHLGRARQLLRKSAPVGKELDFLSQELLREINTLGAKARDSEVVQTVVDMKVSVEQLREQVQNVE